MAVGVDSNKYGRPMNVEHPMEEPQAVAGYSVTLVKSGRVVQVLPGQSILESLLAIGMDPPNACREGICGTCETRVLAGIPDHFDMVLSDEEREANDRMMICCSGSLSPSLVLDL